MTITAPRGVRRRRRRAADGHEDILDAACAVIAERGYESTRLSDVAERAGTSISTLQYLFGNRDDLIFAALQARTARQLEDARAGSSGIADPLKRLAWVATHLVADSDDESVSRAEWMVWTEYWRAAVRDDELREESVAVYAGWRDLVRGAISGCVAAGLVSDRVDVDAATEGVIALGDGLGIQIALGLPSMSWSHAGALTRSWLANQLECPELTSAG